MNICCLSKRMRQPAWPTVAGLMLALLPAVLGCHSVLPVVDYYEPTLQQRLPAPLQQGRELDMVSLPAYRVEPPDLLQLEMLKLVPRPPYRAEVFDVLQIQAAGTLPNHPIEGFYLVETEGVVNLGPAYGTVRVAGMTIEQMSQEITNHLAEMVRFPSVSVQLARAAGTQELTGIYLVGPDGTVNLKRYGSVHVSGKTLLQARLAIERHLQQFFDSPQVSLDVAGYNSKYYYIITQGANLGDNVIRMLVTGNETVLDAMSLVGGISQLSSPRIHIARPAPAGFECEQVLPVDWHAIVQGGSTRTNYQILPGDRVYIAEDRMMSFTNFLAKLTNPVERMLAMAGLGANTFRALQTMGRAYNARRSI